MEQSEKIDAVADMLAAAIEENNGREMPQPQVVLFTIEKRSKNLHQFLERNPKREIYFKSAIAKAIRAWNHWRREGKPCALPERMRPAAKQMLAAMR